MVSSFLLRLLVVTAYVKSITSMSRDCDGSEDPGICRSQVVSGMPPDEADESAALQAKLEPQPLRFRRWFRPRRGRSYYGYYGQKTTTVPITAVPTTTVTTTTAAQPFWIVADANQACNVACSAFNTTEVSFECGKDEMGAINSTQTISDLVASLNETCNFGSGDIDRDEPGAPFIDARNDKCYYWDPTKPPAAIGCDSVRYPHRRPLCYCKPVEPANPDGAWFRASNQNIPCNTVCNANGYTECGKEEMAAINSTETIRALAWDLGIICKDPPPSNDVRGDSGSPFILPNGDCYYWDSTKPPASIDCDTFPLSNPNRKPLCYCKPVSSASKADPDGGWFTGATNNIACDVVCNDNGYAECGEEEMAAINNTQAIEALAWELGIVCTVNSGDPSRNNAGTPFLSGNSCYYWDPNTAASQVDCSSVKSTNRRPFCFCKTLLPEDR
ncbi:unnamed protein product [Symbiodinium sp. CCMP2592]|nr:unnamed protein product [Symbiodinium sp. CCMP2592]